MIEKGKYRHYKGGEYKVIGVALDTETKSPLVLYEACYEIPELLAEYGDRPIFSRPYDMFVEIVTVDGKELPRFQLIEKNDE